MGDGRIGSDHDGEGTADADMASTRQHPMHRERAKPWRAMRVQRRSYAVPPALASLATRGPAYGSGAGRVIVGKTPYAVSRPALSGHRHDSKWAGKPVPHGPEVVGSRPAMTYFSSRNQGLEPPDTACSMAGAGIGSRDKPANDGGFAGKTLYTVSAPALSGHRHDPK